MFLRGWRWPRKLWYFSGGILPLNATVTPIATDAAGEPGGQLVIKIGDSIRPVAFDGFGTAVVARTRIVDEVRPQAVDGVGTLVVARPSVSDDFQPVVFDGEGTEVLVRSFVSDDFRPEVFDGFGTEVLVRSFVSDEFRPVSVDGDGTVAAAFVRIDDEARPVVVDGFGTSVVVPVSVGDAFRPVSADGIGDRANARVSVSDEARPDAFDGWGTISTAIPAVYFQPFVFDGEGTVSYAIPSLAFTPAAVDGEGTEVVARPSVSDTARPVVVDGEGTVADALVSVSDTARPIAVDAEGTEATAKSFVGVAPISIDGEGSSAAARPSVSDQAQPAPSVPAFGTSVNVPIVIDDSFRPVSQDGIGDRVIARASVDEDAVQTFGVDAEGTTARAFPSIAPRVPSGENAAGTPVIARTRTDDETRPLSLDGIGSISNARPHLAYQAIAADGEGTEALARVSISDEFRPSAPDAEGTVANPGVVAAVQPTNTTPAVGTEVAARYLVDDEARPASSEDAIGTVVVVAISVGDSFRPAAPPAIGTASGRPAVRIDDEFRPVAVDGEGTVGETAVGLSFRPVGVPAEGTAASPSVRVDDEFRPSATSAIGTIATSKAYLGAQADAVDAEGTVAAAVAAVGATVFSVDAIGTVSARPTPDIRPQPVGIDGIGTVEDARPVIAPRVTAVAGEGTEVEARFELLYAVQPISVDGEGTVAGPVVSISETITINNATDGEGTAAVARPSVSDESQPLVEDAEGTESAARWFSGVQPSAVDGEGTGPACAVQIDDEFRTSSEDAVGTEPSAVFLVAQRPVAVDGEGTEVVARSSVATAQTVRPVAVDAVGTISAAVAIRGVTPVAVEAVAGGFDYGRFALLSAVSAQPIASNPGLLPDASAFIEDLPSGTVHVVFPNPVDGGFYVGGTFGLRYVSPDGTVVAGATFSGGTATVHDIIWAQDLPGVTSPGIIVGGTFTSVAINGVTSTRHQIAVLTPDMTTLYGAQQSFWTNGAVYTLCTTQYTTAAVANLMLVGGDFTYVPPCFFCSATRTEENFSHWKFAANLSSMTYVVAGTPQGVYNSSSTLAFTGTALEGLTRVLKIIGSGSNFYVFGDFSTMAYRRDSSAGGFTNYTRIGAACLTLGTYSPYIMWTPQTWAPSFTGGVPYTAESRPDGIYAGGSFTAVSGQSFAYLARIAATTTSTTILSCDSADGIVRDMHSYTDNQGLSGLLIAGNFSTIGGVPHSRLAQLNQSGNAVTWGVLESSQFGQDELAAVTAHGQVVAVATRTSPRLHRADVPPTVLLGAVPVVVDGEGSSSGAPGVFVDMYWAGPTIELRGGTFTSESSALFEIGTQYVGGQLSFAYQTEIVLTEEVFGRTGDYTLFDYAGGSFPGGQQQLDDNVIVDATDLTLSRLNPAGGATVLFDDTANSRIVLRLMSKLTNGTQYVEGVLTFSGPTTLVLAEELFKTAGTYTLFVVDGGVVGFANLTVEAEAPLTVSAVTLDDSSFPVIITVTLT